MRTDKVLRSSHRTAASIKAECPTRLDGRMVAVFLTDDVLDDLVRRSFMGGTMLFNDVWPDGIDKGAVVYESELRAAVIAAVDNAGKRPARRRRRAVRLTTR